METGDLVRELTKIRDVMDVVVRHFSHEAQMNAALHMSEVVRPAPLAVATMAARDALSTLIDERERDMRDLPRPLIDDDDPQGWMLAARRELDKQAGSDAGR